MTPRELKTFVVVDKPPLYSGYAEADAWAVAELRALEALEAALLAALEAALLAEEREDDIFD